MFAGWGGGEDLDWDTVGIIIGSRERDIGLGSIVEDRGQGPCSDWLLCYMLWLAWRAVAFLRQTKAAAVHSRNI
jgi:hypothetical protein